MKYLQITPFAKQSRGSSFEYENKTENHQFKLYDILSLVYQYSLL